MFLNVTFIGYTIFMLQNAEKVRALLQAVEEEELEKISKKLGEKTE